QFPPRIRLRRERVHLDLPFSHHRQGLRSPDRNSAKPQRRINLLPRKTRFGRLQQRPRSDSREKDHQLKISREQTSREVEHFLIFFQGNLSQGWSNDSLPPLTLDQRPHLFPAATFKSTDPHDRLPVSINSVHFASG